MAQEEILGVVQRVLREGPFSMRQLAEDAGLTMACSVLGRWGVGYLRWKTSRASRTDLSAERSDFPPPLRNYGERLGRMPAANSGGEPAGQLPDNRAA